MARVRIDTETLARIDVIAPRRKSYRQAISVIVKFVYQNKELRRELRDNFDKLARREEFVRIKIKPKTPGRKGIRVPENMFYDATAKLIEDFLRNGIAIKRSDLIRLVVFEAFTGKYFNVRDRITQLTQSYYEQPRKIIRVDETTYKRLVELRNDLNPGEPIGVFLVKVLLAFDVDGYIKRITSEGE